MGTTLTRHQALLQEQNALLRELTGWQKRYETAYTENARLRAEAQKYNRHEHVIALCANGVEFQQYYNECSIIMPMSQAYDFVENLLIRRRSVDFQAAMSELGLPVTAEEIARAAASGEPVTVEDIAMWPARPNGGKVGVFFSEWTAAPRPEAVTLARAVMHQRAMKENGTDISLGQALADVDALERTA